MSYNYSCAPTVVRYASLRIRERASYVYGSTAIPRNRKSINEEHAWDQVRTAISRGLNFLAGEKSKRARTRNRELRIPPKQTKLVVFGISIKNNLLAVPQVLKRDGVALIQRRPYRFGHRIWYRHSNKVRVF